MSSEARKKYTDYPYSKVRIYWSATIAILSLFLALLILSPVSLLCYLALSVLLTAVVLALKMRSSRMRTPDSSGEGLSEIEGGVQRWRSLLILVVVLIVFLSLPLLLARFNPEVWFISLISYTTSVSSAEVLFFLIARKG